MLPKFAINQPLSLRTESFSQSNCNKYLSQQTICTELVNYATDQNRQKSLLSVARSIFAHSHFAYNVFNTCGKKKSLKREKRDTYIKMFFLNIYYIDV